MTVILLQMIDRKILVSHAQMIYDLDRMGDGIYESFKKQQNIEDEEEWERMLARDGMTVEGLKARLLEMYAPEEVIRFEVTSRIAVGDREVATYYAAHPEEFLIPGQVTIREIVLLADDDTAKENRRAEAAALRQEAASTEDFAALATAKSEAGTRTSGGLLGPLKRGELSPQLEELAFELPVGQVADLLETPYGFHIVLVESRTDDRTAPLEEAQEQLKLSLEDRKYAEELSLFMRKAREDSEWCVKPKYRSRLSMESPECEEL